MESAKMTLVRLDNTDIIATSGPVLLPGQIRISNFNNNISYDVTFTSVNGSLKFSEGQGIQAFFDEFSSISGIDSNKFYRLQSTSPIFRNINNKEGRSIAINIILVNDKNDKGTFKNCDGVYEFNSTSNIWVWKTN